MLDTHSSIAPSSAHIWGAPGGCTGYVKMTAGLEIEDTEYNIEGTAAHDLAAEMFNRYLRNHPVDESLVGFKTENGYIVDNEMYDHIYPYFMDCKRTFEKLGRPETWGFEKRLKNISIHKEFYGTVDFYVFDPVTKTLIVRDLKYGYAPVLANWNWQLLSYTTMIPNASKAERIILEIYQPRAFGTPLLKQWEITQDILSEAFFQLKGAAHEALSNDGDLITRSGDHCRYCPARSFCKSNGHTALKSIDTVLYVSTERAKPETIGAEIELFRRAKAAIEARLTGLEEEAIALIERGTSIPGFLIEYEKGKRQWNRSDKELELMAELFNIDIHKHGFISPYQAEKAGVPKEYINRITKTGKTKKLKSVDKSNIVNIFKKGL